VWIEVHRFTASRPINGRNRTPLFRTTTKRTRRATMSNVFVQLPAVALAARVPGFLTAPQTLTTSFSKIDPLSDASQRQRLCKPLQQSFSMQFVMFSGFTNTRLRINSYQRISLNADRTGDLFLPNHRECLNYVFLHSSVSIKKSASR
jgi:hypothetical protein